MAEKRYQHHLDQEMRYSRGRMRGIKGRFVERETDLSDVLDFRSMADDESRRRRMGVGVKAPGIFTVAAHPGFYFLAGRLDVATQVSLATAILGDYAEPPADTNHTKRYGHFAGLWGAARDGRHLDAACGAWLEASEAGDAPGAPALLDKLRWISLGPKFDWTARVYRADTPHRTLPSPLHDLAEAIAHETVGARQAVGSGSPPPFDVALVNLYAPRWVGSARIENDYVVPSLHR